MVRNRLYVLVSTACATGYIWLFINYHRNISESIEPGVCLFKRITGIPCPSCGSTRSVLSILKGDFVGALFWNPFGVIIMSILILAPLWILYDIVLRKDSLLQVYNRSEIFLRQKWIAIPLILLVILNWIWNIYKGL
ncbi:DUF2752 domain-containing protein [Aquipluma nitroreducens]|nr:DUF2752 domain-containing protein [Aquipluma nitroreducens]